MTRGHILSFEKSRFIDNYAKYSGVLKNVLYTRMNAVLTLFVLAESTQVK